MDSPEPRRVEVQAGYCAVPILITTLGKAYLDYYHNLHAIKLIFN